MKTNRILAAALFATFAAFSVPPSYADETKPPVKEVTPAEKKETLKPYKLDTCVVSDEKLDAMGKPFVFTHEGQEIKLCCKKCKAKFDKDPATYLKKLDGK
jgi:YHS domain-containing protein